LTAVLVEPEYDEVDDSEEERVIRERENDLEGFRAVF
jgi:hypothetical protein